MKLKYQLLAGFLLAGAASAASSVSSLSLRYLNVGPQGACRAIAASSDGFLFTACTTTLPSGRSPIRVIKTDSAGNTLNSFDFGGSGQNVPAGIAADAAGNIIVVGTTLSGDLPLVSPLVQKTKFPAGFVTKIDPNLKNIVFSTLLGGSQNAFQYGVSTSANAVTIDGSGNIYVTGSTNATDFPVTAGAFQTRPPANDAFGSASYAFVSEIAADGSKFVFSTYFGGDKVNCQGGSACIGAHGNTVGNAIQLGQDGSVLIAGNTSASDLPVTKGVYGSNCASCSVAGGNGFSAKLQPGGAQLAWATYFGPNSPAESFLPGISISTMALAPDGSVVLGGESQNGLPVTPGVVQGTFPSGPSPYAGFVAELDSTAAHLKFSTYIGGTTFPGADGSGGASLAIDSNGTIWVTGNASTDSSPTIVASFSPEIPAFIAGLSADGTSLLSHYNVLSRGAGQGLAVMNNLPAVLGTSGSLLLGSSSQGPSILGFTNAASQYSYPFVAPYELITLYGIGLASAEATGGFVNNTLPTSLNGTQALFNGVAAPLLYVGPNQINAIVPLEIASQDTVALQVITPTGTISGAQLFGVTAAPAVFGNPQTAAAAVNQDGTVNSALNPASVGSVVTVWATGAGLMSQLVENGSQIIFGPQMNLLDLPVSALAGNFPNLTSLDVLYAGVAPGAVAGVTQINFRLPQKIYPGPNADQIFLQVGDAMSPGFYIYVKP